MRQKGADTTTPPNASGDCRPPLLLLPGTVCDERVFARVISFLGDYPVLCDPMTGAETAADLAACILDRMPERVCLCGFSLGGIVALEIVAQAPERVAGLALLDTTPRPDPPANAALRRAAVARARLNGMESYISESWENLVAPANATDRPLHKMIHAMAKDAGPDVLASQSEVAIHRADSRPRLGQISVPTLVLRGEDDDICPRAAHLELAEGIRGSRYVEIARAGHFAPMEQAEETAVYLRDLLTAVQAARHVEPLP